MKTLAKIILFLIGGMSAAYAQLDQRTQVQKLQLKNTNTFDVMKTDTVGLPDATIHKFDKEINPVPLEIPNLLDQKRKALVKDISVPIPSLKLTGEESVMMPGTEKLDVMKKDVSQQPIVGRLSPKKEKPKQDK